MSRASPEHDLQRACVRYLLALPPPPKGPWWTAVNPYPFTSPKQGAQAKVLGVRAGTPDLLLLVRGRLIGIELKSATGRVSDDQKAARIAIELAGGAWHCVRSIDEFAAVLGASRVARVAA